MLKPDPCHFWRSRFKPRAGISLLKTTASRSTRRETDHFVIISLFASSRCRGGSRRLPQRARLIRGNRRPRRMVFYLFNSRRRRRSTDVSTMMDRERKSERAARDKERRERLTIITTISTTYTRESVAEKLKKQSRPRTRPSLAAFCFQYRKRTLSCGDNGGRPRAPAAVSSLPLLTQSAVSSDLLSNRLRSPTSTY